MMPCTIISKIYSPPCNTDLFDKNSQSQTCFHLQKIYKALDEDDSSEIVALYTDFSKTCDKVPHFELLCKTVEIGDGGCILEFLLDYMTNRKQFLRVENICSQMKDVKRGVPQETLLGPLLFCIFINDLHEADIFSGIYLFADDVKVFSINRTSTQIQRDLHFIENWVSSNKMEFDLEKCAKVTLRGDDHSFNLLAVVLNSENKNRDLGILVTSDLNCNTHINNRRAEANSVVYLIPRNIAYNVSVRVKTCLYKSLILPILPNVIHCIFFPRQMFPSWRSFKGKKRIGSVELAQQIRNTFNRSEC